MNGYNCLFIMCVDYWLMANGKKGELTDIYNFESPKFTLIIAFPQ